MIGRRHRGVASALIRGAGLSMNATERSYSEHLELRRLAGEILEWAFEPERLRLSHSSVPNRTNAGVAAWYTPDFRVVLADGSIVFHEVKGRWEEAALARIRVAADLHPYRFCAVYSAGRDGFEVKEITACSSK